MELPWSSIEEVQNKSRMLDGWHERGQSLVMPYDGWPRFEVVTAEPLEYRPYGFFRNRAPHVTGDVTMRGLLVFEDLNPFTGGPKPGMLFESGEQLYADGMTPQTWILFNQRMLAHAGVLGEAS